MTDQRGSDGLNRRQFLRGTAGAALALSGPGAASLADGAQASAAKRTPTDLVPLGKTGLTVSRLGFGTGMKGWNRQSNQTKLGFAKFIALLRHAFDSGVRLFDMADLYGAHVYVREALRPIPREKVTLQTKIWWRWGESPKTIVERFRHELGTDYIDIVLLHCMTKPDWDKELTAYMDMLSELKAKKIVRAIGISCHALPALRTAAKSPWVDTVLARINHKGTKMDGPPEKVVPVIRQLHEAGKGVVGMKIYGEGKLVDERAESLRYVLGLSCVDAMVIGFEAPEHIDDALKLAARAL